eukprot:s1286_g6.t1
MWRQIQGDLGRLRGLSFRPRRMVLLGSLAPRRRTPCRLSRCVEKGVAVVALCIGVTLFYLYGVVPISYQGKSYNIPVTIYFDAPYPKQPPRCFVTPTNGMALKPNHLNVDAGGMIYLPYLSSWSESASTLPQLVTAVTECFSASPPVYSTTTAQRPTQEQQAAQPAQQGPVAGVLNFLGLGGQQSTPAQPAQPATAPVTPVVAAVPVAKAVAQPVQRPVATVIATTVSSRNEKEELTKAVTASMKERWPGIVEPLTKDLKEQMDRKEELQTAQAKVEQEEKKLQDAVAEVQQQTHELQNVERDLDSFIQAESGRENFDPDAFLETMDPDRRQVLDLLSEELSYEELLTALDELLASRKIGVDDFMREVRDVSRQQFMCKMKRKKAEKAVNAANGVEVSERNAAKPLLLPPLLQPLLRRRWHRHHHHQSNELRSLLEKHRILSLSLSSHRSASCGWIAVFHQFANQFTWVVLCKISRSSEIGVSPKTAGTWFALVQEGAPHFAVSKVSRRAGRAWAKWTQRTGNAGCSAVAPCGSIRTGAIESCGGFLSHGGTS